MKQLIEDIAREAGFVFWGEEEICNIGITRVDFDLRELGIEIKPQAVFMGSIFSDIDSKALKRNCKPKLKSGQMCSLISGSKCLG